MIIGNPPYNDDIYIDFAMTLKPYLNDKGKMVLITPAKWQGKGDELNSSFRKKILPYVSEVVNYFDTCDIWKDLQIPGGVAHYCIETEESKELYVTNKCFVNPNFTGERELHEENPVMLFNKQIIALVNKCLSHGSICDELSFKRCEYVEESESGVSQKDSENYIELCNGGDGRYTGPKIAGYISVHKLKTAMNIEKYKCIQGIKTAQGGRSPFDLDGLALGSNLITVLTPYQVPKGTYQVLKYFDDELSAKSFQSVYLSKLCGFLQLLAVVGQTQTKEFWRFEPVIEKFDHIYTDEELYAMFGLNEREINIVETTIRARKK